MQSNRWLETLYNNPHLISVELSSTDFASLSSDNLLSCQHKKGIQFPSPSHRLSAEKHMCTCTQTCKYVWIKHTKHYLRSGSGDMTDSHFNIFHVWPFNSCPFFQLKNIPTKCRWDQTFLNMQTWNSNIQTWKTHLHVPGFPLIYIHFFVWQLTTKA